MDDYTKTHIETWLTLKIPEALLRVAGAQGWLLVGEDEASDLSPTRIQDLGQKAQALVVLNKRGPGRHV
jgi:hypothetical protein